MSERSPYREIGTSASAALRGKEGRKPEPVRGLATAYYRAQRRGRRPRRCPCGQLAMGDSLWCLACHGGRGGPRWADRRRDWRRDAVTKVTRNNGARTS